MAMLSVRITGNLSSLGLSPNSLLRSADPDLSNPTRPRLERPLDTIRSFEAAIYGTSINNRASYARTGIGTVESHNECRLIIR